MLDDVLHNQCVQVMDVDQVMVLVEEDQVMVLVEEDQVMVLADITEMHQQETNTKEEEVHVHHMVDKPEIVERSGRFNT